PPRAAEDGVRRPHRGLAAKRAPRSRRDAPLGARARAERISRPGADPAALGAPSRRRGEPSARALDRAHAPDVARRRARVKIVFVMRSLHVGGAERQLVELARGLRAAGHAVAVKLFYGNGALEPELADAGIPVDVLEKRGRWEIVRFLVRLAASIRAERPDVVHSYLPVSNIFTAILRPALGGARVVWAIRASDMNRIPLDWPSRAGYGLEA